MCAGLGSRCEYAIIIDSAQGTPHMTNISKQLDLCVGRGKFTCCDLNHIHPVTGKGIACDKVVLSAVCRKLLNAGLTRLWKFCSAAGSDLKESLSSSPYASLATSPEHAFRYLLSYRRHLLEGLPIGNNDEEISCSEDSIGYERKESNDQHKASASAAQGEEVNGKLRRYRSSRFKPSSLAGSTWLNTSASHWSVREFFDAFLMHGDVNDVPYGSPNGFTPLRFAVLLGDVQLVSDLISMGANLQVALDANDPVSGDRKCVETVHACITSASTNAYLTFRTQRLNHPYA